jgi:hypothetical protein
MIRKILILASIILGVNVVWMFSSPLVKNAMLEGKITDLAHNRGLKTSYELRQEVMSFAVEKGIPLPAAQLIVEVSLEKTLIAAHYTKAVEFWFLNHTYEFTIASDPDAKRKLELARARRVLRAS